MQTILLTGGAGFIGSHTAVEALDAGYDVIIADDLSNSERQVVDRIEKISGKSVTFHEMDLKDEEATDKLFETYDIDAVVHFAGFKAVGESVEEPLSYYNNNLRTALSVFKAMAKHGVNCFVFSSSATVYSLSENVPFDEESKPLGATNPYGWTKYMIEQVMQDVATASPGSAFVALRYFNPVGAHPSALIGEKPKGIPNNLMPYITQVAAGIREKLNIFGNDYDTPDGTGVRDYIHVVDLAKGHIAALKYATEHTGYEVFNIGTGRGQSVLELVHAFENANAVQVPYEITGRRAGDIATCYADTGKAERLLKWKAQLGVEDMCKDAWRWEQNRNK